MKTVITPPRKRPEPGSITWPPKFKEGDRVMCDGARGVICKRRQARYSPRFDGVGDSRYLRDYGPPFVRDQMGAYLVKFGIEPYEKHQFWGEYEMEKAP